jgi:anti-sigma factor RsiW
MMKKCLDEGMLQAYLDGELSPERAREASAHVAQCVACAGALAAAEGENLFFSAAFAPDDSVSVPTEMLRARLGAAVARLEPSTETPRSRSGGLSFGGFLTSLSGLFTITPQSAVAFAGLLAVLAFAVVFFAIQRQPERPANVPGDERAKVESRPTPLRPDAVSMPPKNNAAHVEAVSSAANGFKVVNASARHADRKRFAHSNPLNDKPQTEELLPGEKGYQTAIASLEKTIKMGGDAVLRPALRVNYERNLAILNSAISETRRIAAQNPQDKDAVGFLMSTYQSKVELLTKVADQAQVATLGR